MGIAILVTTQGQDWKGQPSHKYIDIRPTDGPFEDYSPSDKIVYYPETNMAILSIYRVGTLIRKTFFNIRDMRDFFNTFDAFSKGVLICILLQCVRGQSLQ